MLGLQGASEYHISVKEVCVFSVEILMTWNWKIYYEYICTVLVSVVREVKKLYYNELIANSGNKVKMTWKIIKNLTGKIQNFQYVSPTFKLDGLEQSPK